MRRHARHGQASVARYRMPYAVRHLTEIDPPRHGNHQYRPVTLSYAVSFSEPNRRAHNFDVIARMRTVVQDMIVPTWMKKNFR